MISDSPVTASATCYGGYDGQMNASLHTHRILETCIYVDDLAAAEQFYESVLGLQFVSRQEGRHAFFRCGTQMLLIFNPQESNQPDGDLPPHGAVGAGHIAFAVTGPQLDQWKSHLESAGVCIEREIDWPQGGRSFYFRDPAGNSLEMAMPSIWGLPD